MLFGYISSPRLPPIHVLLILLSFALIEVTFYGFLRNTMSDYQLRDDIIDPRDVKSNIMRRVVSGVFDYFVKNTDVIYNQMA